LNTSGAAVQDNKIGPDKDIPHVSAPVIVKYITDLELLGFALTGAARRRVSPHTWWTGVQNARRRPARRATRLPQSK